MKKNNKKLLALLISVALLLTFAVSGTVAFLADGTGEVVNTFTPTEVDITVTDKIEDNTKKNPTITNTSNIPVYIRVAVVAYWKNTDGNIVAQWENVPDKLGVDTSKWDRGDDGFYYHKSPVPAGESVVLFTSYKQPNPPVGIGEDAYLQMDIIAQAIQADGVNANNVPVVTAVWGAVVDSNGNISK